MRRKITGFVFITICTFLSKIRPFSTALVFIVLAQVASAQTAFTTSAPYVLLMDAGTGAVLYEKAADELMAPASMTKMMTAAVVFEEIRQGRLKLDNEFTVSENAWRRGGAPSGGSTMFALVNSRIKIEDLIQGLVIQSGNDAAIALAEGISGDETMFAQKMTQRAREIGLAKSVFRNASGMGDPQQRVTARELGRLALHIIETYPDLYGYFGRKEFTWNKIRQQSRNPLLTMDIGADGLKTGNIDESGFGLTGSAVQNGQRLIVVLNGLKTARERAQEARKLLEWGFRSFEAKQLFAGGSVIGQARVFGGEQRFVDLVAKGPVKVLIPRGSSERITARIVYQGPLPTPIAEGQEIARLKVQRGEVQALDIPLYAASNVQEGSLTRRAFDAALELGSNLMRRALASVLTKS